MESNHSQRKRKFNSDAGRNQGSRNGGSRDHKRHKKGDMGRGEYFASNPDKRDRTERSKQKRDAGQGPSYGTKFSQEEIDAEERRPKRKVAVLIGYAGTGYKGMQISASEKTIEGDLFKAFIAAGAISKANADDPKKASLVRCARTDKGVHAAGNMISLKLIVEDEDIVEQINEHLVPQIRVWGIERTIGSFSCYQACDSRWYEYLIPSYAFLPPHSSSWLAKQLQELADKAGDREGYEERQKEVRGFWDKVDEEYIKPVLETIDEDIRADVIKALQGEEEASATVLKPEVDGEQVVKVAKGLKADDAAENDVEMERTEEAAIIINEPVNPEDTNSRGASTAADDTSRLDPAVDINSERPGHDNASEAPAADDVAVTTERAVENDADSDRHLRLRAATKQLRQAYTTAKRHYRIPSSRVERIQQALDKFIGTHNFHNYTIQKTFRDPSAKRHIKSFVVNKKPILISSDENAPNEEKSEWLSLKIHGQSFMMHQIRKMVGMVALLVRCGSDLSTLDSSLGDQKFSIPKVPGLGLLLERPVFDSYNDHQAEKHNRPKLDFSKFEDKIEAFKQKEIYRRVFGEEEAGNEFGRFFNHIDHFREGWFLWVGSGGIKNCEGVSRKDKVVVESEDEGPGAEAEG